MEVTHYVGEICDERDCNEIVDFVPKILLALLPVLSFCQNSIPQGLYKLEAAHHSNNANFIGVL